MNTENISALVLGWPASDTVRADWQELIGVPIPIPRYAGSIEVDCAVCGLRILIGPRGYALLTDPTVKPVCGICAAVLQPGARLLSLGNPDDLSRR